MTKKYKGVFRDKKGRIYCQTEFKASADGKRQRFKSYRDKWVKHLRLRSKPMMNFVEQEWSSMTDLYTLTII